ncbi:hypothetical protein [Alteribacillus sp. YIM 98480]|uniref:hypothetical protein n=1 Tax=Alteribacillus sp. YIM 98480 TaxID=2606599 RepID=UPI00131BAAC3|nr:hypothetical protein [Alteribacillus sp. YIM 98480]
MTTVISYVNSAFSVILSDNRINYGHNQEGGYQDGFNKLINLPEMGWSSGAGLSDFLVEIKDQLGAFDIKNTDDILHLFKDVLNKAKENNVLYKKEIDESVIVSSWLGSDGNDVFFRVGMLSNKHFGINLRVLEKGEIDIVYPGDYLSNIQRVEEIKEKFNLTIGETDLFMALNEMLQIFDVISSNSTQVSRTCDIGLFTFQEDGVYKIRTSGDVEELKKHINNKELGENAELVNVIKFNSEGN